MEQIFQILVNGGIVLSVFIIFLLHAKGVRKTKANTFLSILLGAMAFNIFHLRYAGDVIHHLSLSTYSLGDPTFLLIAPLLWFYIVALTGGRTPLNVLTLLHFIPFLAIIFFSLSLKSISSDIVTEMLNEYSRLRFIVFWIVVVIQFSVYQFFIYRKWKAYQSIIRQEVSNTEDISISWVQFFMSVFLIINSCFLLSLFVVIHFNTTGLVWKSVGVLLSLSIFALGYKGILQREIFSSELIAPVDTPILPMQEKQELASSELLNDLIAFMENKKPYLDAELSLSSLSKQMGMNRNQLSQLINIGTGENFYDFVNKYRVEEVKRLMHDPQKQNYNLLGIAVEAGFKSKSTFNLIFKRFTGLTPTEYKKNSTKPDVQ